MVKKKKFCLQCWRPVFDPWVGKIPWRTNGYSFQDSCLEKPMDRGVCQATYSPWGCIESDTTE